jgi:hypothetical protein
LFVQPTRWTKPCDSLLSAPVWPLMKPNKRSRARRRGARTRRSRRWPCPCRDRRGSGLQPGRHPPRPDHRGQPGDRPAGSLRGLGRRHQLRGDRVHRQGADGQPCRPCRQLTVPAPLRALRSKAVGPSQRPTAFLTRESVGDFAQLVDRRRLRRPARARLTSVCPKSPIALKMA